MLIQYKYYMLKETDTSSRALYFFAYKPLKINELFVKIV